MKYFFSIITFILISVTLVISPVAAKKKTKAAVADNFIYSMSVWDVGTQHGEQMNDGTYHMGQDGGFDQGSGGEVYATANGEVVEVSERSQFGLVILIEHVLSGGNKIVSQYGHLSPSDIRVSAGQVVSVGDAIGSLGNTSENGGWTPHLHFGLHKSEYSGEWVYAGHVTNPLEAEKWYDPATFIPNHLMADTWFPEISADVSAGDLVGDLFSFNASVSDLGSGVQTVEVQFSDNGKKTWETIKTFSESVMYPYPVATSLSQFDDGRLYMRIRAVDGFGNKTRMNTYVVKKGDAFTRTHVATMKGEGSPGSISTFYQSGDVNESFMPYAQSWKGSGDLAVGDVKGNGANNIVTMKGEGSQSSVKVMTKNGTVLNTFKAFPYDIQDGGRIATGDIDGDGVDEVIVGSGPGQTAKVKVFTRHGTLVWKRQPFRQAHRQGVDVAAGDVDGDGIDEVIVGLQSGAKSKVTILTEQGKRGKVFRAFEKEYRGGVNVGTGDVDGDGIDEIIVGSGGERIGEVRTFELTEAQDRVRQKKKIVYVPFGSTFTGPVDVSTVDWEEDGKDEVVVSQAGGGEAWIKTYRYAEKKRVLFEERVYEEGFEGGTRVDGWN